MSVVVGFFLIVIITHYLLYPGFLFLASRFVSKRTLALPNDLPKITMIVAAYNEQRVIEEKIRNSKALNYPQSKLEIIIVSDGSSDQTPQIVDSYKNDGIIGLHRPERQGKTAALNRAVKFATGEILVFSDANSYFVPNALNELIAHFHSEKVGGVCGRKAIVKNFDERLASMGDNSYWNVESKLKHWQSLLGGITNADGEIFALRKELYPEIDSALINDDQIITFEVVKKGKTILYAPNAITCEEASITLQDDFNVKRRMICGAFQAIGTSPWVINPFYSKFSFHFFFHKFLRYIMFALITGLMTSSIIDAFLGGVLGIVVLSGFTVFLIMGIIGQNLVQNGKSVTVFYIPYYYLLMNYACYKGLMKYLEGSNVTGLWVKAAR